MSATTSIRPARLVRVAGKANWHILDPDGRRLSTGTPDRQQAQAVLDASVAKWKRKETLAAGHSVRTLLSAYLAARAREITEGGAARLRYAHMPLNSFFGDWTVDRINIATCLDYRDHRLKSVVLRTIRTELEALRAALRWGMTEEGGRVVAQMPDLRLPPKGNPRPRHMTRKEADRLLANCKATHLKLFVQIGLNTGARSGAILALEWDRVDLDQGVLEFRVPDERETVKRKVPQPINADLLTVLTAAKAVATSRYVISRADGSVASIKHGFASACERAGLEDVTPHTMRHSSITWMLMAGVPVWEVANFAGMTTDMVERTYGHATVQSKRRAASALENQRRRK
jgi:integrase